MHLKSRTANEANACQNVSHVTCVGWKEFQMTWHCDSRAIDQQHPLSKQYPGTKLQTLYLKFSSWTKTWLLKMSPGEHKGCCRYSKLPEKVKFRMSDLMCTCEQMMDCQSRHDSHTNFNPCFWQSDRVFAHHTSNYCAFLVFSFNETVNRRLLLFTHSQKRHPYLTQNMFMDKLSRTLAGILKW